MNYFDDLKITHVHRAITCKDSICIGPHGYYGLGIMMGEDCVTRVYPDTEITMKTPFIYLITPSSRSGWRTAGGTQRDNRWIIMEGPRAERLLTALEEVSDTKTATIRLKNYSELIIIHQKMLELYRSATPAENYRLSIYAESFAGAIYDALGTPEQQTPIQEFVNDAAHMITENPGGNFDFEAMANKYKISYFHFRRCFVEIMGIPLHEFVLQKRFTLAVSMLKSGSESIKEIADICGFQNPSDFSRFIKIRSGCTPSELKKHPGTMEI